MHKLLSREEIHQILTTNMQDWKKYADIEEVQNLNDELSPDDLITICSSHFFDDVNDKCQEMYEILDGHFMNTELSEYHRSTFILIHNIYNK